MKYKIAYSDKHNCTNPNGHAFSLIYDKQKIIEIRTQHPQLKVALWKCHYCGKITESM